MTLPVCLRWSKEMERIIKPNGILMLSFHGASYLDTVRALNPIGERLLARDGYYMHLHGAAEDTFYGSNDYAAFMTLDFIRALFGGFSISHVRSAKDQGPSDFGAYQDIAVFRKH